MYEIKTITDEDIYTLFELHYKLQQLLPIKYNRLVSAMVLMSELKKSTHLIVGLYKTETLVGFINGWEDTEEVFYLANVYVQEDSRFKVKELMQYAEDAVITRGYKQWKATSILEQGMRALEKFGGVKR